MGMVKLRILDDRFQGDIWRQGLESRGIPHILRTYEDTAYDGLFVSQKGYGVIYVDQEDLGRARLVDQDLMAGGALLPRDAAHLARFLDHTLLDPDAGEAELDRHLGQCLEMGVAAACVSPWMTARAARALAGSPTAVCTVVSFPLGADSTACKVADAVRLAEDGARELDVVFNRGWAAGGRLDQAVEEMDQAARAAAPAMVKVILETSALGPELTRRAARALAGTEAAFLKTGTGYFGEASVADVELLRAEAGENLGIKAAGGVRTLDQALELIGAGAERLGTSSGAAIYQEAVSRWGDSDID